METNSRVKAMRPRMCQTIFMSASELYARRLGECEARLARLEQAHTRVGSARLAIGALFLITAWFCLAPHSLSPLWLLAPLIAFIAAVMVHQRVQALRSRAQRAVLFYRAGLQRIADQWSGTGPTGERFELAHHIYSADLDLFGNGGLFQLLCAARTQMGEATLAQWLLAPAPLPALQERHASVVDLRTRLDLREDLAIQGDGARIELHPDTLTAWAEAPNNLNQRWIRVSAPLLAVLGAATAIGWAISGVVYPLLAVLLIEVAVTSLLKTRVHRAMAATEGAYEDLKSLALLLKRIEAEPFDAAPLRALVLKMSSQTQRGSETLAKLATIVNYVESRRNPLLVPLTVLLMLPLLSALAAERWRTAHGKVVRAWLEGLGEMEALVSLARYSHEHPDDPFPQFVEGAASFQAAALGHPLIPAAVRVSNDVKICPPVRALMVSGSNMSGKSTLLRTVGINTVLAMAGAPVRAQYLKITPLRIGASIRINDSLHEGSSRFYAEITRLRQFFEPADLPLLFLLDELLQGTNAADRRIGSQGVIRALILRGGIGLVSTHDLALTDGAGLDAGALVNVHFQDELVDGRLAFDFKLQAGVVTKSNGIALMRSIGLDV
jgi:hypothetical protein